MMVWPKAEPHSWSPYALGTPVSSLSHQPTANSTYLREGNACTVLLIFECLNKHYMAVKFWKTEVLLDIYIYFSQTTHILQVPSILVDQ